MELDLTDRQRELRDLARQFRAEVIEPIEPHRREWIDDPDERFPWEVVEAGSRWGLRTLTVPRAYGGAEASVLELCLVVEELAAGDMGIAVVFDQTWKVCDMLAGLATPAEQDWFFPDFVADDRYLLAIGVAEPAHATDVHLSRMLEREGTRVGITTVARPDGDGWVIDGRKQMPSCGSTAKLIVVMAQTEPGRAVHDGCSYFLLPAGTPGFSVSRVWDKISQRLADNAGLVFDGCRVGPDRLLGTRGGARSHPTTAGGNIEAGATTLGSARGAYEQALAHARRRVQGGRPIIEHQAIGMMLAEMATELESARSLIWRAAAAFDAGDTATPLQYMAKWHAAEVAVRVCVKAMEIIGGASILRDSPVQKYLRDCLSFLHSDGTQQSRLLLIQQRLIADGHQQTARPEPAPAPA
jgi:alkylation response protein AidB-like acyl-CoA dehydrogenase